MKIFLLNTASAADVVARNPSDIDKFHCTKNEVFYLVRFTEEILNGKLHFLCSALI